MLQSNDIYNIYHFHTCSRTMLYLISIISRQMLQSNLPEDNRMSLSVLMYEVSVQRLPLFLPSTFVDSISRAPYTGLFCPKSFFFPFTHSIYYCSVLHLPKLHCVFVQEWYWENGTDSEILPLMMGANQVKIKWGRIFCCIQYGFMLCQGKKIWVGWTITSITYVILESDFLPQHMCNVCFLYLFNSDTPIVITVEYGFHGEVLIQHLHLAKE